MKSTIISIIISIFLIAGAVVLSRGAVSSDQEKINNVAMVNGIQIIKITAKGGYVPSKSTAKANVPTIIRVDTNGTFDCSSIIRIPDMKIAQNLPQTGTTDIDIGLRPPGIMYGTCGMGMYPFEINFQ